MQEGNFPLFLSRHTYIFLMTNKTLVIKFKEVITKALEFFPELKDIKIEFVEKRRFHFTVASLINR